MTSTTGTTSVPLDGVEAVMRRLVDLGDDTTSRAARHHLDAGGKRVRARLAMAAGSALGLPDTARTAVAAAVELLHNATLVHDDLQDRDRERRGRPAVWVAFDEDVAICVGDLLLSAASAALADAGGDVAGLLHRMHTRVGHLVRGQVADLAFDGSNDLDDYLAMARGKSGALLGLPLELPLLRAGHGDAVDVARRAGDEFAVGYQAADDLGDVHRDRRAGAPNVVDVLRAGGEDQPAAAAVRLASAGFTRAAALARSLPDGAGALLADEADRAVLRLRHPAALPRVLAAVPHHEETA